MEWTKHTVTFDYLKGQINSVNGGREPMSSLTWLKLIGVIPITAEWRRGNRIPNTNLNPDAIPAGYLAEFAYDWDSEGRTTPAEFLEGLSFEVSGTKNKEAVVNVMNELTTEAGL